MTRKPNICSGFRRRSLVRSASLRSGLATIFAICSVGSGELCCVVAALGLRNSTELIAIAARRSFRLIVIGLPFMLEAARRPKNSIAAAISWIAGFVVSRTGASGSGSELPVNSSVIRRSRLLQAGDVLHHYAVNKWEMGFDR